MSELKTSYFFAFLLVLSSLACEKKSERTKVDLRESGPSASIGEAVGTLTSSTCKQEGIKESRVRYESKQPVAGEECKSETQTRSCSEGQWSSWSGTFAKSFCSSLASEDDPALQCDGKPNGSTQNRTAYEKSEVASSETNNSETQTRTCEDGEWSPWSGTNNYQFASYKIKDDVQNQTTSSDEPGSVPPSDETETVPTVTCLGYDTTTAYQMNEIEVRQFYVVNLISEIGQTCEDEANKFEARRTCSGSGWIPEPSDSSVSADWTTLKGQCSRACMNLSGTFVPAGSSDSRSGFLDSLCSGTETNQTRTCTSDGVWDAGWGSTLYTSESCDELLLLLVNEILD